jgi:hypothetical protein
MHPRRDDNCTKRKFNSVLMLLCCCASGLLGFSAAARPKAMPITAKLLPPETILLIDIDNFQQLKTQFEKTGLYRLYKDPAMAAFVDNAKAQWNETNQKLDENNIFRAIFSTELWPEGRAAAALVLDQQSKDFNEPSIVVITQWGKGIDKIKEAIDKMLKKNIEVGGHQKRSEKYRGVSIETIIDETSETLNLSFIGDSFIAATNIDLLKFVIAHIKGAGSPTLAEDSDYNSAMKAVGPFHDIDFYVNVKQVVKTTFAEDSSVEASQQTANLGIDNIAALGCSAAIGRSPSNPVSARAFLKINGTKRGICKMLDAESAGFTLPPFIPASAYSVTFINLDIKKAYDELYSILYSFSPRDAAMLRAMDLPDSPDGQPGLNLKNDIISYLGSQIVISQSVNKPFSNTSGPTESLVALAVNDRETIEKSLSILHSRLLAPNNPDARRELLGHTIYLLSPSSLPFLRHGPAPMSARGGTSSDLGSAPSRDGQALSETGAPQIPALAFTVTDTYLIFASEAAVERAIRALSNTEAPSAGATKWFTFAKQAIPSAVGVSALEDNAATSEIFWWKVKRSSPASTKFDQVGISKLFNFALLPEFDTVRKYFGLSALYGISTPEGFFFEFKYINPTES